MQVVTGNAASSIAFRNAVFKVIPKAYTKKVIEEIKQVALGQANNHEMKRQSTIKWFEARGVTLDEILQYIEADCIESIDAEKLLTLRATCTAIKEGTTSIAETFKQKKNDSAGYAAQLKDKATTANPPTQPEQPTQAPETPVSKARAAANKATTKK